VKPNASKGERAQVVIEVDVQPLAAGRTGLALGDPHELQADSAPAGAQRDERVEHEGVAAAVPDDVHEADEVVLVPRRHPAEAVALDLLAPVPVEQVVLEALRMQRVQLDARERAAPLAGDAVHYTCGRVTAPSLALETCDAYLAKTPVV
jgi:hypothetical protein